MEIFIGIRQTKIYKVDVLADLSGAFVKLPFIGFSIEVQAENDTEAELYVSKITAGLQGVTLTNPKITDKH
ncbi:MAG TPA: hypothetical protein VFN26_11610 [Candidatus Acidoferrum sp.]|nr:hypothetical protein [Candidatus Acidoferrum sp.]